MKKDYIFLASIIIFLILIIIILVIQKQSKEIIFPSEKIGFVTDRLEGSDVIKSLDCDWYNLSLDFRTRYNSQCYIDEIYIRDDNSAVVTCSCVATSKR